jgi:hypothetical protein
VSSARPRPTGLAVTAAVACVGYTSGQAGVDVVMLIDRYALWIMLALILGLALYPAFVAVRDQRARRAEAVGRAEAEYDEETARLEAERADGGTRGE